MSQNNIPAQGTAFPFSEALQNAMLNCAQNPRYHAEGDVLAHTRLVLDQFYRMREEISLSPSEERILYWSCLLHDAGKPLVTREEKGRITAGGHEYAGVHVARQELLQYSNLNPDERRMVLDIVRWHYIPFRWGRENRPESDYIRLSFKTDLRLIALFSLFDFHGRICENQESSVRMIEDFVKITEPKIRFNFGGFEERRKIFAEKSALQKDAIWYALRKEDFALVLKLMDSAPDDAGIKYPQEVKFTWGLPGSGKSAWLEKNYPDLPVVQLKDFQLSHLPEDDFSLDRKVTEFTYHINLLKRHYPVLIVEGDVFSEGLWTRLTENCRRNRLSTSVLYMENPAYPVSLESKGALEPDVWLQPAFHFMNPHPFAFHNIEHLEMNVQPEKQGVKKNHKLKS